MIEVRHFEIVEAIAGSGSVTRAAKRLHLTQPAVSHALRELEKRLGVPLFVREPGGMVLTREGARMRAAGVAVLREVSEVEHDLARFREGCQGIVRVSTECYTCYHWLPAVLQHFAERLPGVDVQIVPEATADPLRALLEERLDLAIVHSEVTSPLLVADELFSDEMFAIVRADHALAGRAALEPRDFAGLVLVLHSDPAGSAVMTDFLEPAGVRPARVVTLQLTEAVLHAVRAGLGVSVMAGWAVRPEVERGDLAVVRLGESGLRRSWRVATRKDRSERASIRELSRLLAARADPGDFASST